MLKLISPIILATVLLGSTENLKTNDDLTQTMQINGKTYSVGNNKNSKSDKIIEADLLSSSVSKRKEAFYHDNKSSKVYKVVLIAVSLVAAVASVIAVVAVKELSGIVGAFIGK